MSRCIGPSLTLALALALAALLLSGCPVEEVAVPVAGLSLAPDKATISVGGSIALAATFSPAEATDRSLTWKSDAEAVATVSAEGRVSGVAVGTATITATSVDGGKTASAAITVTVPVSAIALSESSFSLFVADSRQLVATASPAEATDPTILWSSDAPGVATVSAAGLVTAVGTGTALISARSADGGAVKTATARVLKLSDYLVSPTASLNDAVNYRVESFWLGRSSEDDTYVYGVAKLKYLGSTERVVINAAATFKDASGATLLSTSGLVQNRTTRKNQNNGQHTLSFFSPSEDIGYWNLIANLGAAKISDITSVDLSISDYSFTVPIAPVGHASPSGTPYRVEPDSWYQGFVNDGGTPITVSGSSVFYYEDDRGRLFYWSYIGCYRTDGTEARDFAAGESGYLASKSVGPAWYPTKLLLADLSLGW